jgi:hypothetical protein
MLIGSKFTHLKGNNLFIPRIFLKQMNALAEREVFVVYIEYANFRLLQIFQISRLEEYEKQIEYSQNAPALNHIIDMDVEFCAITPKNYIEIPDKFLYHLKSRLPGTRLILVGRGDHLVVKPKSDLALDFENMRQRFQLLKKRSPKAPLL